MKAVRHIPFSAITGLAFLAFFASCGGDDKKPVRRVYSTEEIKEASTQMGEWDSKRQKDEIDMYIRNHGWEMQQTGTGMYYMFIKKGEGDSARLRDEVLVDYKIFLLDGTLCYSSEKDGAKWVLIGQDNVESGLHGALKMMHVGDRMRLILPSHLAHGLTGDDDKIPPRSSVLYEIEILKKK